MGSMGLAAADGCGEALEALAGAVGDRPELRSKSASASTVPTTVSRSTIEAEVTEAPLPEGHDHLVEGEDDVDVRRRPRRREARRATTCWRRARLKSSAASAAANGGDRHGGAYHFPWFSAHRSGGWTAKERGTRASGPSNGRAQGGGGGGAGGARRASPAVRTQTGRTRRSAGWRRGVGRARRGRRGPSRRGRSSRVPSRRRRSSVDAERQVIRTAELEVRVDTLNQLERALAVVEAAGGSLASAATCPVRPGRPHVRGAPDAFLDVLGDLAGLGDLTATGGERRRHRAGGRPRGRLAATTASVERLRRCWPTPPTSPRWWPSRASWPAGRASRGPGLRRSGHRSTWPP